MMLVAKIIVTPDKRMILAVCDKELLGRKFEAGKRVLDLTSGFYKGEEKSEKEVAELMKKAYVVNLVGEKAIELALENNVIEQTHIIFIKNIPHAQGVVLG